MESQSTSQQRRSIIRNWKRIRLRPGALIVIAFLAGVLLRPALQHCLTETGVEVVELLAHPANNWSGEALKDDNIYTASDRAMLERIEAHDHNVGRITLAVILIILAAIGLRWVVLLERRNS